MRQAHLLAILLLLSISAAAADTETRLEGVAFTEEPVTEVRVAVWALGDQVAEHPEWQFTAVFEGVVVPGKAFSVDLGEAQLPVVVELVAENHVAVALEVVLPEQLVLPPAWLRRGGKLAVRVTRDAKPAADALVWGRIDVPRRTTFDPWRWETVVARTRVPRSGSVAAVAPDEASWISLSGLTRELEFGIEDARDVRSGSTLRLAIDATPAEVRVFDRRGRPAAGVPVIEASSPAAVPSVSDEGGRARVWIPASGQWSVVAVTDEAMARAVGSSPPEEAIELQLGPRKGVVFSWSGALDPMVLELSGHSPFLGGSPRTLRGGSARLPVVVGGWVSCGTWGPATGYASQLLDGSEEEVMVDTNAPVTIDGRVTAPEGVAVEGLPVFVRLMPDWMMRRNGTTAFRPDIGLRRQWLPWTVTGEGGRFSLRNLPQGVFELETRAPGFPLASSERVVAKAGSAFDVEISLTAGVSVSLAVVDPEGTPLGGVMVEAYRAPPAPPSRRRPTTRGEGDPETRGATGPDGRVVLAAVPAGGVQLKLTRAGFVSRWLDGIEVPAGGLEIGEVVLVRGVTIRGTAVGPDGEAVGGAEVAMRTGPEEGQFRPTTMADDDGVFRIPDLEPVNSVYLQARAEGLVPEAPLKVELPPEAEIVVEMASERVLEGVVLRAEDDVPLDDAQVSALAVAMVGDMMRASGVGGRATTGDDGRFRIGGLREGRFELQTTATGRRQITQSVEVPKENDPEAVVVRLEEGLTLRGRVETADGEPAPGLRVDAIGSSTRVSGPAVMMEYSQTQTSGDGSFHFDDLGPGAYRLMTRSNDGFAAEARATAGQDEPVVLRLDAGEVVTGVVIGEDGTPVAAANVIVQQRDIHGPPPVVASGPDGRFRVENIQPGEVTVIAEAEGFVNGREETEVLADVGAEVVIRLERGGTVVGVVRGLGVSELERTDLNTDLGGNARPASDGSFELTGVEPGDREIFAHARATGRSRSVRVAVPKGGVSEPVVIDFSAGLRLSGRVLRDGSGVQGMAVSVTRIGVYFRAGTVSEGGGVYLIDGLEPGEYEIAARSRSGEMLAGDHVLLETDSELDLHVAGGRLTGRVLESETGNPVDGATVLVDATGLPAVSRTVVTDAAGAFAVDDLADGEYRVSAEARGRSPAQEMVTLRDFVPGAVTLRLDPEESTVFVVREPDGSPAGSVAVISAQGGVLGPSAYLTCDQGGRCAVAAIPRGVWTLLIRGQGAAILKVSIPAAEVPVQLRPRGELKIIPPPIEGGAAWQVRVTEASSGLVVPVIEWRNPGRAEWVPVTTPGLKMWLPEGAYRVEIFAPDGTSSVREVIVSGGGTATVQLE